MAFEKYKAEEGPVPEYGVSQELSSLTIAFIVSSIIYFLAAGSLAIVMRIIQSGVMLPLDQPVRNVIFYSSLTIHGQLMFFGFLSMLTIGISYFLLSKFAKKPLISMRFAVLSFILMNSGAVRTYHFRCYVIRGRMV